MATPEPDPARRKIGRRRLLRRMVGGGFLAGVAGALYSWRVEPVWPRVVERDMPYPDLPDDLVGLRIVQVSDLHVGTSVPLDYLRESMDRISDLKPDLLVATGDLVHTGQSHLAAHVVGLLGAVRASEGAVVILGNHDWGGHSRLTMNPGKANAVTRVLRREGLTVLRNQSITIRRGAARFHVVGLEDFWSDRFDPPLAFHDVPPGEPCLALVHNPDAFPHLLDGPAQWTLAGHTHGGQVSIPLLGPPLLPVENREISSGHYRLGGRDFYVNPGLGWLIRVRFNARPEITCFTLARA